MGDERKKKIEIDETCKKKKEKVVNLNDY